MEKWQNLYLQEVVLNFLLLLLAVEAIASVSGRTELLFTDWLVVANSSDSTTAAEEMFLKHCVCTVDDS